MKVAICTPGYPYGEILPHIRKIGNITRYMPTLQIFSSPRILYRTSLLLKDLPIHTNTKNSSVQIALIILKSYSSVTPIAITSYLSSALISANRFSYSMLGSTEPIGISSDRKSPISWCWWFTNHTFETFSRRYNSHANKTLASTNIPVTTSIT